MENKTNALVNAIISNHDFKGRTVNGEQIDPKTFEQWKALCDNFAHELYDIVAKAQNYTLNGEEDYTKVFATLKPIRDMIGEVNGFTIACNLNDIIGVSPYVTKTKAEYSTEMKLARDDRAYYTKRVKTLLETHGVNPEAVKEAQDNLAKAKAKVSELELVPKSVIGKPDKKDGKAFRVEFEDFLARKIKGQMMKSYEELKAEEDAKKAERKAKRQAKRQAEAKAKAEA